MAQSLKWRIMRIGAYLVPSHCGKYCAEAEPRSSRCLRIQIVAVGQSHQVRRLLAIPDMTGRLQASQVRLINIRADLENHLKSKPKRHKVANRGRPRPPRLQSRRPRPKPPRTAGWMRMWRRHGSSPSEAPTARPARHRMYLTRLSHGVQMKRRFRGRCPSEGHWPLM